jgi:hypothetical protein
MRASIKNRAAAIRHYLNNRDLSIEPVMLYKFSIVAAQWEAVRLLIEKGKGIPADDRRFTDLTHVLQALSKQIGLGEELTDSRGFLIGDPSRIIAETWVQAAERW